MGAVKYFFKSHLYYREDLFEIQKLKLRANI